MESKLLEEIAFVISVITHPAGYDLDLFGDFCIRPTDQGVWCVDWADESFTFDNPRSAAEHFVRLRFSREIGIDFEDAAFDVKAKL